MKTVYTRPRAVKAIQITAELRAAILGGKAPLPPGVRVRNSSTPKKGERRFFIPELCLATPDAEIDLQDGDWIVGNELGRLGHCPADEFDNRFFGTEAQAIASVANEK